jgi:cathepsin A (carboxypeptidase C)
VGFSYSKSHRVSSTTEAAQDVNTFLQLFFKRFRKYSKLPIHISGESYAGKYIPAIAKEIHQNNIAIRKKIKKGIKVNIQSIAIGNGFTDPLVQYKSYPLMAKDAKYGPILNSTIWDKMEQGMPLCEKMISDCYHWKTRDICR